MRSWKKIGIGIVLATVVIVAGLAVWQKENVKALYMFLSNDSETIAEGLEDKRQEQQAALAEKYNVTVVPPSTEQNNDLLDGKVSPDEVKESLGIVQEQEKEPSQEKPDVSAEGEKHPATEPPVQPEQPEKTDAEKAPEEKEKLVESTVNQCVAELYSCEVDLMAMLGEMKQAAVAEWVALPEEERTPQKKMEIGFAGLEKCYDLEVEIDRQVTGILAEYRAQLEELEADTAVVDELWKYYCDKKASEKAYYLNKYTD